jgi:hypothetical protein
VTEVQQFPSLCLEYRLPDVNGNYKMAEIFNGFLPLTIEAVPN